MFIPVYKSIDVPPAVVLNPGILLRGVITCSRKQLWSCTLECMLKSSAKYDITKIAFVPIQWAHRTKNITYCLGCKFPFV